MRYRLPHPDIKMNPIELKIRPAQVRRFMLTIISILTLLHVSQLCVYFYINDADEFDFIQLFDFDYEGNLPSFYSALALLYCAIQLWFIAKFEAQKNSTFRCHWFGLSGIFGFLALDEATALHEEVGDFVETLGIFEAEGFLYFAWVVPYGLLMIVFLLSYFKFVLHLPLVTKFNFILSGALFVLGAVGIETFSAKEADMNGTTTITYSILYTLEELFEMIAIVIFAHSLLMYQDKKNILIQRTIQT